MVEKKVNKKSAKKISSPKKTVVPKTNKVLMENFISLQKVMTNLSLKIDNLTTQISQLLELFEISAKALAEKEIVEKKGDKENKEIIEKIDNILEQNKTIARGVALIHEKEDEPVIQRTPQIPQQIEKRPLPSTMQNSQFKKISGS